MKLSEKQIQTIDAYLKTKGIGYWDIRLEMTDHIACKIEIHKGSYDFHSLFMDSLKDLGWEGDLKVFEQRKLKSINKGVRKAYFSNFIGLFTKIKSLLGVMLFVMAYYFVFQYYSYNIFKIVSFLLFGIPITLFTIHYVYMSIKFKKSGYLLYGYFYIIFSMFMANLLYQFPKPGGIIEVSEAVRQNIVFFTTIFNVLLIWCGIKIYIEISDKYKDLFHTLTLY
jgi:hypothetical protein